VSDINFEKIHKLICEISCIQNLITHKRRQIHTHRSST